MESFRNSIPKPVTEAMKANDKKRLSEMGKKGAQIANENKLFNAAIQQDQKNALEIDLYKRSLAANEHITPIDETTPPIYLSED